MNSVLITILCFEEVVSHKIDIPNSSPSIKKTQTREELPTRTDSDLQGHRDTECLMATRRCGKVRNDGRGDPVYFLMKKRKEKEEACEA